MFEESEEPTIAEDKLPSGHLKYLDYEPLSLTSEAFLNRKQSLLIVETQLPSLLIESTRPPFLITMVDFGVYHAKLEPGPQVVTIKAMGYLPLDLPAHPSYDAGAIRKIRVFPKE
ncbi:MAG: hypothetical protein MAG453_01831 [Calditrichaeota bacterium]|nr:hypothetical protein [Calditrichota bacterium]